VAGTKQFDPDSALAGAIEVFRNKGFAGTSMQDLEKAMGLGRGSIYNTFGDKQALFIAALQKYRCDNDDHLAQMLRDAPRAIDGIRFAVRTAAVHATSLEGRPGCLIGNTAMERVLHDDASAAIVQNAMDHATSMFTEALERAQREGDFPQDRDPHLTARYILLGIQGLCLMSKATPDAKLVRGIAEEILRTLD